MESDLPGSVKPRTDLSLQAVIECGKQLQKEKLNNLNDKPSLHVLNEEVPCVKKVQHLRTRPRNKENARTRPARTSYTVRSSPTRSINYRSTSPGFIVSPGSPKGSITTSKRRQKCPLRIAELAVPSKRHCIETWRDRNDVLPSFMLERLKQLVMNQKVVATVPDAVQCFKYHRSECPTKRCDRDRGQRKIRREDQDICDIKIMSAVFSQRIARRLMKKTHFEHCLSDNLAKLSKIVGSEIKKLIQNRKVCADYVYDADLLNEMSAKITLWIVDILEEAQSNMMEDELKVQKDHENKMGKDGNLETLIDQYLYQQLEGRSSSRFLDLEEEEGPALDAIDTLVENVLDICLIKKESISIDFESPGNDIDTDETTSEEAGQDENIADDFTYEYEQTDIDTAIKDEVVDKDSDGNSEPETGNILDIPDENGVYNISNMVGQEKEDSDSQYDSTGDVESDSKKIVVETTDGDDTNVSDVSVTLEESLDDRKKVKFSEKDDGAGELGDIEAEKPFETEAYNNPEKIKIKSIQSLGNWPNKIHSATYLKSDIVFQPPNPSILSVADESWPDDFMTPLLKPSASVSKSITSLGEIKEVDEPVLHNLQVLDEKENSKSSYESTISSMTHKSEENITKQSPKESWVTPPRDSVQKVPPSKLLQDLKTLLAAEEALQFSEEEIKQDDYDAKCASAGKGDHIQTNESNQEDTDTDQHPIVQAIKEKLKQETQAKFDYRVHPQTAPSWARTSASEDSESYYAGKERPLDPGELRKWCQDLEHTLINLEQWNKWIVFTCKQILFMKHQTGTSKLGPHERTCVIAGWTKLKKCIDKDAILWRKLNDRTLQVLQTYSRTPKLRKKPLQLLNKRNIKKDESISEAMLNIEGMSVWLHRSIVSTEHVVKCNCCNITSRPHTSTTKRQRKKL